MKVLIADDEPTSRLILGAALTRFGHSVELVEDGNQAWAALQAPERPGLVILDWNMPGLAGPEVCRLLRARRGGPYTYAILVTTRGKADAVVQGLEAGADDYIAKPFDPEELRARVRAGERIIELQAEMDRSRAYLNAVLANIDSGVLLADHSGRVVYANAALARLSGTPVENTIGLRRDEFLLLHARRFDDPEASLALLGLGRPLPLIAELDVEAQGPQRRTYRWIGKAVALAEGPGQLDLYRDVTDEVVRDREREQRIRIDHLTGLYNRHGAEEIIVRELARARRTERPLSLVMVDIDRFKRVNDTFGHGVGDRVLAAVSRVVAGCCRVTDAAIRWGGEELLVILPDTTHAGALNFAERLRASVEALTAEGQPPVTISCGVAELQENDDALASARERADQRLYEAKAAGRNRVR